MNTPSDFDVDKGEEDNPLQPTEEPEQTPEPETKTIMAHTWPIQVPVRVPIDTEEQPENPDAGENEDPPEESGEGE